LPFPLRLRWGESGRTRREASAAALGLAAVVILVASLGTMSWWAARSEREAFEAAREHQVRTFAPVLGRTAEQMLSAGELSALRRTLVEMARDWKLSTCRIVLDEGQVIADADPKKINVVALPERWVASPPAPDEMAIGSWSYPVPVTGHGVARLELASAPDAIAAPWESQAGIGLIGASTLALLLLLYRRAQASLRPLTVVREALLAVAAGEQVPERLEVDGRLGPEAVGWNRVLDETKRLRQQARGDAIAGALAPQSPRQQPSEAGELDAAFDVMSHGLLVLDASSRVRFANGAATVYLGVDRKDAIGHDIADVIKDKAVLDAVREVSDGAAQGPKVIEVRRGGDAGAVLRFVVRRMRRGDIASAMIVVEDVTQQRVADEARNNFVAQVAHELRAPLTNIRLYVESAIDLGDEDPAVRGNALNVINQESRRLERIIGEMLSISEIEAGSLRIHKDDVHLDVLLDEARVDFEPQAKEKQVALEFLMPPKLPVLQGDRDKLALAVHNLVGNAIKYTPAGGKVTVRPDVTRKHVNIEVADTGIGIKPDELEKVFERFYRAKDERVAKITGTGLGLTLAREVARLHGGDVTAESQVNQGSTFTLALPLPGGGEA
jgi:PAS domain S-box-containing protein